MKQSSNKQLCHLCGRYHGDSPQERRRCKENTK